jgi:hypothetical protein
MSDFMNNDFEDYRCNCYSAIDGFGTESMRVRPYWDLDKWVSIDVCIWPAVKMLWRNNIKTLGSCCGHGDPNERSIVIDKLIDAKQSVSLLKRHGFEDTWVMAWDGDKRVYFNMPKSSGNEIGSN